jgi:hypothetical protein
VNHGWSKSEFASGEFTKPGGGGARLYRPKADNARASATQQPRRYSRSRNLKALRGVEGNKLNELSTTRKRGVEGGFNSTYSAPTRVRTPWSQMNA